MRALRVGKRACAPNIVRKPCPVRLILARASAAALDRIFRVGIESRLHQADSAMWSEVPMIILQDCRKALARDPDQNGAMSKPEPRGSQLRASCLPHGFASMRHTFNWNGPGGNSMGDRIQAC
jgi:hypothetical protein